MIAPSPGKSLRIYLASTTSAIGALLAQEGEDGVERPVYYVSRQLSNAELRYLETERNCLTLVYASQRLRHYFLSHKLLLMVKSDPLKYLLTRPVLSGRLARWLLQLSEFDITCTKLVRSKMPLEPRASWFSPKCVEAQQLTRHVKYCLDYNPMLSTLVTLL
ncbi:hypothetical protein L484_009453 [Morus notabilis]|uniref:Reverse transcriptase RNase H-like domain-containing protein n=1 Tax=Morus notabilis TaxID=981085 RepID=W9RWP1_9ROSA|nr:hypothetical protein L484_009453 [Morus notabilis]